MRMEKEIWSLENKVNHLIKGMNRLKTQFKCNHLEIKFIEINQLFVSECVRCKKEEIFDSEKAWLEAKELFYYKKHEKVVREMELFTLRSK